MSALNLEQAAGMHRPADDMWELRRQITRLEEEQVRNKTKMSALDEAIARSQKRAARRALGLSPIEEDDALLIQEAPDAPSLRQMRIYTAAHIRISADLYATKRALAAESADLRELEELRRLKEQHEKEQENLADEEAQQRSLLCDEEKCERNDHLAKLELADRTRAEDRGRWREQAEAEAALARRWLEHDKVALRDVDDILRAEMNIYRREKPFVEAENKLFQQDVRTAMKTRRLEERLLSDRLLSRASSMSEYADYL